MLTIEVGGNVQHQFKSRRGETTVHHGTKGCSTKLKQVFLCRSLSGVQKNNFLFLFGTDNERLLPVSMRYNVSTNQWIDLKPVPRQATVSSTCSLVNDNIYLLGGMFVNQESALRLQYQKDLITSTAHCYSILNNEWLKIDDLPQCLAKSASCSVGRMIHVCGGMTVLEDTKQTTNKHYAYDTAASLWVTKPAMLVGRCGHVLEAVDSVLYVFGGKDETNTPAISIESFDIVSEQWTVIQDATFGGVFSSGLVSGDIFITGGFF